MDISNASRIKMKKPYVPVAGPWITQHEIDYVTDAVTNAWYEHAGCYNQRFESAFASYVGRKFAISLPSCTSALHLALLALGIQAGDEVIVPEITWIATSAPINYVGATPVFADIDANTWCLSSQSFESSITARTKAVIVVDLYGNMPEYAEILAIAQRYGIAVIEDAAEAIGSEYCHSKAGSFGAISTFSFHGSKTLTTGEGGMLVTDSVEIYERCLVLRDHGRKLDEKTFWNSEVAYKYKMSNLQAALGLGQLERIEQLVDAKRQIFAWYKEILESESSICLNSERPEVKNSYWMVTAIVEGVNKEKLGSILKTEGIDTRPFFYPLSTLPAYAHLNATRLQSVASRISPYGINLPSALSLTKSQVHFVAKTLLQVSLSIRAIPKS
jgi:perosamine synthetase